MLYSDEMKVELITYADYIPILNLMRDSHEESRFSSYPFDADMIIERMNVAIELPNLYGMFKCVLNDVIIGIYIGFLMTYDFSPVLIGIERLFFVRKESRGSKAAKMLKEAFERWAKNHDAIAEMMIIHHNDDNRSAYQLCEKMGMKEVGKVYERSF